MKEISMIIRPEKLEEVKSILDEINCGGMTITTAMGCGAQKGVTGVNEIKGFKTTINLLPKMMVSVVVEDSVVEPIIMKVREKLATDHVGDGKILSNLLKRPSESEQVSEEIRLFKPHLTREAPAALAGS